MKSLAELWDNYRENDFQAKVAAVTEAWGDDAARVELLDEAVDLIKEAEDAGEIPALDASDTFSLAVTLVEDYVDGLAKEAEEEVEEVEEEMTKEAAEYLGAAVGEILEYHDVTEDDIEKLAEAELDELAEFVAGEFVEHFLSEEEA
jgi:vacuolar-type H+-ATPase subunit E/Vma4